MKSILMVLMVSVFMCNGMDKKGRRYEALLDEEPRSDESASLPKNAKIECVTVVGEEGRVSLRRIVIIGPDRKRHVRNLK